MREKNIKNQKGLLIGKKKTLVVSARPRRRSRQWSRQFRRHRSSRPSSDIPRRHIEDAHKDRMDLGDVGGRGGVSELCVGGLGAVEAVVR